MEKVILFGPFGFLGYSLCKAMLDEGIQVYGVTYHSVKDHMIIEEKQMEIGRNANFIEKKIEELPTEASNTFTPIIIPVYDLFIVKKEMEILKDPAVYELIRRIKPENSAVTFLLPEQYRKDTGNEDFLELDRLMTFLKSQGYTYKEVFLPTLYGPWQPKEYLFQQLLFPNQIPQPRLNDRESVSDAIFIDDLTKVVLDLLKEAKGKFLIRSGADNNYVKGLEYIVGRNGVQELKYKWWEQLAIRLSENNLAQEKENDLKLLYLSNPTEITDGIQLQRRHFEQWVTDRYSLE